MNNYFSEDFQYDSCVTRGICSMSPKNSALQTVIVLYLRICAKYLIKIIEKMQKNTKNFGKKPKIYQNYSIIDEQLDLLKRRLNLAIKEKRFEDAARFDDDIKRLEGGEDDE